MNQEIIQAVNHDEKMNPENPTFINVLMDEMMQDMLSERKKGIIIPSILG